LMFSRTGRHTKPSRSRGNRWLSLGLAGLLMLSGASITTASPADIQVSVFNMPNLNGAGTGCAVENDNLIKIIDAVPGYNVDGTIVDFVDQVGQPTLASQLAASRFFFMTDMENQDPNNTSFLPDSALTAFRNWTNAGGVMVMTGTHGVNDVNFLNRIYSWNLVNTSGAIATETTANTAGTPFANATSGASLVNHSATESISPGTVPNFKPMWQTSAGNSAVAVIQYGAGYVIYMGWDFFSSGPGCSRNTDPWVTGVIPAALRYATELSQSGLENATTSGGDLKYTFSQNGTAYYVVVNSGSTAPTNAEIKSMANYGSVTVRAQGSNTVSANVERVFPVTGLAPAADFTAYIVTEYFNSGTPTFSTQQIVNFSTKPGSPTVASVTPDSGKVTVSIAPFGTETNYEYSTDGGTTWVSRSPASNSSPWEISGLTNGTTYNFQFRSAFKTLRSESTSATSATPSVQPAYLSNIVPSAGTLSPGFSAQTLTYSLNVENSVESITVTPTSSGNSITVAGRNTTSGQASSAVALRVGSNEVTVSVLRQGGGAAATVYTLQVTRADQAAANTPTQQAPTLIPTPAPTPILGPRPTTRPTPIPGSRPIALPPPVISQAPSDASNQPSRPVDVAQLIPNLAPTPNVAFSRANPVPPEIVTILSTPLAYSASSSGRPSLPELSPVESVAFENGSEVEAALTLNRSESGYVINGNGWRVNLEATDNSGVPVNLDDSGNLILNEQRTVSFSGTGFAPGSIIKIWLFSDPQKLSTVTADANGSFSGTTTLPEGIPAGEHTVQLNGLTTDGQVRSVALGVVVQPDLIPTAPTTPTESTDYSLFWNITIGIASLILFIFFIVLARKRWFLLAAKRRKRKEEKAELKARKLIAKKQKRQARKDRLFIEEIDPFLAQQVAFATPLQQFPVDSRRKLGRGAPPKKTNRSPFKRNRPN